MKTALLLIFFALLFSGCGYTVLDFPRTTEQPYKTFRIYIDSVDVPFEFTFVGRLSHSIPWQGTHYTREPNKIEKSILLRRLIMDADFFSADGLTRVRFYSRLIPDASSDEGDLVYYSFGEAVMISHVEKEDEHDGSHDKQE